MKGFTQKRYLGWWRFLAAAVAAILMLLCLCNCANLAAVHAKEDTIGPATENDSEQTEDRTPDLQKIETNTASGSGISRLSFDQATNAGGGVGAGYMWNDIYWLGAFKGQESNAYEWCVDLGLHSPVGAGTIVTELTPHWWGQESVSYLQVTNAQMGWILKNKTNINDASTQAAIAFLVHANYEQPTGKPELIKTMISDLLLAKEKGSTGSEIIDRASELIRAAEDAGVAGVYLDKGSLEKQRAQVKNVGIKNGAGQWMSGQAFTLSIQGDGVFEPVEGYELSQDQKTLSGRTVSSPLSFWVQATSTGTVKVSGVIQTKEQTVQLVDRGGNSQSTIEIGKEKELEIQLSAQNFDLIYDFQPIATSQVADNVVKDGKLSDTLTISADPDYHQGRWTQIDSQYVAVLFDGTAYLVGDELPQSSSSDQIPADAQVVGHATILADNGPGEYSITIGSLSEVSGYVTWVWQVRKADQTATYTVGDTKFSAADFIHADWADAFGLAAETTYQLEPFQPKLISNTKDCKINQPGNIKLCDQLTVYAESEANQGIWPTINSQPIEVVFQGSAYYVGETPGAVQDGVPETATLVGEANLTVHKAGTYEIETDIQGDYQPGFITWVWKVEKSANLAEYEVVVGGKTKILTSGDLILADWQDQFGLEDETIVQQWEPHVVSAISSRETADGTFLVDDVWVTGLPSNHGQWEGTCRADNTSETCFAKDEEFFTQTLYFYPQGLEVNEANKSAAEIIGSAEVPAKNGFHASIGSTEWLWPQDANGNNRAGTVVFQTSFAGDARLPAFMTDIEDETEQITSGVPHMSSLVSDQTSGSKQVASTGSVTLVDQVSYSNLSPGKNYALIGLLVDKNTGQPILDVQGKEIRAESSFTLDQAHGSVGQVFSVEDSSIFAGKTVVVYEYIYDLANSKSTTGDSLVAADAVPVLAHENLGDTGQTFYGIRLNTTATDAVDGDKTIDAAGEARIVDLVEYQNLTPGREYQVSGTLVWQSTGQPVTQNGQAVTATTVFIPESENGIVTVEFRFDATKLGGKSVVVFEDLYQDGQKVATHSDLSDQGQTVRIHEEKTLASTGASGVLRLY